MLEGTERDRLVYGDILDAYSTEAFGAGVTRSPEAQKMQERLAVLNVKELKHGLSSPTFAAKIGKSGFKGVSHDEQAGWSYMKEVWASSAPVQTL